MTMDDDLSLKEYRALMCAHYGLSPMEMMFAPWWLRIWRRAQVILERRSFQ
jgi:hypothetical protein